MAAGVLPAAAGSSNGGSPAPARPGTSLPRPQESAPELRRGPYIQALGSNRAVIRWRTSGGAEKSLLRIGTDPHQLTTIIEATRPPNLLPGVEDWMAVAKDLEADQTYYYAIEATTAILAGADEFHSFRTAPKIGTRTPVRFWALGDCGTNRVGTGNPGKAVEARNGFRTYDRGRNLNGILLLGDNAYSHGTDSQYQTSLFSVYADELRRLPVWPCIGNHELTDDYFSIFTVPEEGETGGVPSHFTNYYSFDYANIHFTILDLWKAEWRSASDPQRNWLERDLKATSQDWRVVINHFPPYCDGKYESDSNGYLVEFREKILPVLEANGVDLLLTGHDHTYQRSYLIDGHHGPRSSFDPAKHRKAWNDESGEPIVKKHGPHSGLIAVVSGTAGAPQLANPDDANGTRLGHPAMVKLATGEQDGRGVRRLGTFLLEVDGLTLTGTQVDEHGRVVDRFQLKKI